MSGILSVECRTMRRSGWRRGGKRRPGLGRVLLLVSKTWNCIQDIIEDYINIFRCDSPSSVNDGMCYRESQFTLQNTPAMVPSKKSIRMMRTFLQSIPCINPANVIFRDRDVIDVSSWRFERNYHHLLDPVRDHEEEEVNDDFRESGGEDGDEEQVFSIDVKAELFIQNFYRQQRQLNRYS